MNDLIERQAAINIAKKYINEGYIVSACASEIMHDIENIPSAHPQRKGKWIKHDTGAWSCDQCSSWIPDEQHYYANYCLYCGADMRGDDGFY